MKNTTPVLSGNYLGLPAELRFGPFRLDRANQSLCRNGKEIFLAPKAFAVLSHLAAHSGNLVTKEELLDAVWSDVHVTDGALKRCVAEIRKALEDPAADPVYIQTLHGRGYRFLPHAAAAAGSIERLERRPMVVGRQREMNALDASFDKAAAGERQIVFVIGEAGLGKTTLVNHWLRTLAARSAVSPPAAAIGNGRCLQQFGSGEPYLPVFEALEHLSHQIGPRLASTLRTHAPTWLVHMPSLVSLQDRIHLREEAFGTTRDRMLRELVGALEVLSAENPVVLVLEDLHWSDPSTIDLLTAIASRPVPARLMVLATHRPAEMGSNQPLRRAQRELEIHGQCLLMPLGYLTEEDVRDYVAWRISGPEPHASLSAALHRRTSGNPLFVTCIVDELMRSGNTDLDPDEIREILPETIQNMFEHHADQLTESEREIVNAAAAEGELCSTATLAVALARDETEIEGVCEALVKRQVIFKRAEAVRFPDGGLSPRYSFLHVLCRDALYRRLTPRGQARLHGLLGDALEVLYQSDPSRIASELAGHFELAGNFQKAIRYLRVAADGAAKRFANLEAARHLERALDLLDGIAEPDKASIRMDLLEQRAIMRLSTLDLNGSAEDLAAVSEEARRHGDANRQARALLDSVMPWGFLDYRRCLAVIEQARALRLNLDPVLAALVDAFCAGTPTYFFGRDHGREQLFHAALPVLSSVCDPGVRARYLWMEAFVRSAASDYAACCRAAEEVRHCARKTGSFHQYFLGTHNFVMGLIHRGDLGKANRIANEAAAMAAANHHSLEQFWFDSLRALVAIEAYDYGSALSICERLAGEPLIMSYNLTPHVFLWLGMARLGAGALDGAAEAFDRMTIAVEAGGVGFEYRFPLLRGQSSCALARGDFHGARDLAARSVQLAETHHTPGEAARGYRLLSEIASAAGDHAAAAEHISAAAAVLTDCEMLNLEWQVYATAAKAFGVLGRSPESEQARMRAQQLGQQVAATLAGEPALQASLLSRLDSQLAFRASA